MRNGFGEAIQEASPDTGTSILIRDARGLVTQLTDARSVVTNFTYDDAARLLTKAYPATPASTITYAYDATASGNKGKGQLTSLADQTGSIGWTYDGRGNVLTDTRIIAGQSYATAYSWSLGDDVETITYPSGRIVTYTRNAMGQITDVATKLNALSPAVDVATAIAYKPMSDLISGYTLGNGLVFGATYDQDYRIASQTLLDGATPVSGYTYAYVDDINLTAIADTVTPANNATFTYTAANRLSQAAGPWGTLDWTYDGVGNRLSETLGGTADTYAYSPTSNRLATLTRGGSTIRSFAYDAIGNIVTDTRGADVIGYTYDDRNRPVAVSRYGGAWASYAYNGLEQLVIRSTTVPVGPIGGSHYVYDLDGHLIAEADALTGATIREYLWLDDRPVAIVDTVSTTPVLYFVHADHLARPVLVTDSAKAPVWSAVWKPFGEAQAITGPLSLDHRFPGQWFQIETGLAITGTVTTTQRPAATPSPTLWASSMAQASTTMPMAHPKFSSMKPANLE
jgi:YD repeat-containing protein